MKKKINYSEMLLGIIDDTFQSNIMSTNRCRDNVDGRRAFCAILKNEGYSYNRIGRFLNKNHATIIHYTRGVEGILQTDPAFYRKYNKASTAFLKRIDRLDNDLVSTEINKLKDKITAERSDSSTLTQEVKRLHQQKDLLEAKLEVYNEKYNKLYSIISLRTKPGTEEFIQRKLNTFYNGIYSEEISCY